MAGFDLASLLPFYLDETDEQIAGLNDALLKLEQDRRPTTPVLREAFRLIHSIKGSSTVMGFDQVKDLTHHLETFFDQLRERQADARPAVARPLLPLPRRPPRLPPRPPGHGREQGRPRSSRRPGPRRSSDKPVEARAGDPRPSPRRRRADRRSGPPIRRRAAGEPSCLTVRVRAEAPLARHEGQARPEPARRQGRGPRDRPAGRAARRRSRRSTEFTDLARRRSATSTSCAPWPTSTASRRSAEFDRPAREPDPATRRPRARPSPHRARPRPRSSRSPARAGAAPATRLAEPAAAAAGADDAAAGRAARRREARRKKVAETLRVDVDRLDQLMNLAGELVISKARFFEIARGLEDLFRDSNAAAPRGRHARTGSTAIAAGLEGARRTARSGGSGSAERWAVAVPPAPRELPGDPGRARPHPPGPRAAQRPVRGDPPARPRLRRHPEEASSRPGWSRSARSSTASTASIRDLRISSDKEVVAAYRGGEDRARQADDRRAGRPADPHGPQLGRPRPRAARRARGARASPRSGPSRSPRRTGGTAW